MLLPLKGCYNIDTTNLPFYEESSNALIEIIEDLLNEDWSHNPLPPERTEKRIKQRSNCIVA